VTGRSDVTSGHESAACLSGISPNRRQIAVRTRESLQDSQTMKNEGIHGFPAKLETSYSLGELYAVVERPKGSRNKYKCKAYELPD
jgi:hypothetical protein